MGVSREQRQSGQRSGTDSKAFTDCSGGVAHRIQRIGDLTYAFRQFRHFRNTAGIIGNRTISVNGNGNAGSCQHTYSRQGNTINTQFGIGCAAHYKESNEYGNRNKHNRQERRIHTYRQTGNNNRSMTGFSLIGNAFYGTVVSRSIYFSNFTNEQTYDLTGCNSPESIQVAKQGIGQVSSCGNSQDTCNIGTGVQSALRIGRFAVTHIQNTDNRRNNAAQSQQEGVRNTFTAFKRYCAQCQGRDDRPYIGFEQVSAHAGHVTYVIAYVISDGGGVTRIVFRNAGFYFTNQVSAYVSSLRINTAAHTGKQCNGAGAQTKACNDIHVRAIFAKHSKSQRYAGNTQANYAQAHDRTAGESDLQCLRHTMLRGCRCTNIGFSSHVHAEVTG